jgi:hypothetical protein
MSTQFNEIVNQWTSADRAYNSDCNLRSITKPDKERILLQAAADRAFKRLMREMSARFRAPQKVNE